MIIAVGAGRHDQARHLGRAPVAVERAEEQLGVAPVGVEIRFGVAARDDAILLAEVVWVVLEAGVEIGMCDSDERAEPQLHRQAAVHEAPVGPGRAGRLAPANLQRVAQRVRRGGNAGVPVDPVAGPALLTAQRRQQAAHCPGDCGAGGEGVDIAQRAHHVGFAQRPRERRGVGDHARGDQVLDVRCRPVIARQVRRRLLGRERRGAEPDDQEGAHSERAN